MADKKEKFDSVFKKVGELHLPKFSGTRIMMVPLVLGDIKSVPDFLREWNETLIKLMELGAHPGKIGYLTIDEKIVKRDETHRRAGAHVDGAYHGGFGGWGGGGGGWGSVSGGGWGGVGTGMLTVANRPGCKAWNQTFVGRVGWEGEAEHLMDQAREENAVVFGADEVYWVDGACVHTSLAMTEDTPRQFVRLSLPSAAPWFEGYTENPLGVKPSGPILSRRQFMDA